MTNELLFSRYVEGGAPMTGLLTCAQQLSASTVLMPSTTAALLDLPGGTTYAQGAAAVLARSAAGVVPVQ